MRVCVCVCMWGGGCILPAGGDVLCVPFSPSLPSPSPSDHTPHLILSEHPMAVTSLAIDWDSQNLYWVDSQEKRVEVSRTDGTNQRVLHSGMVNPTGLALDPESM